MASIRDQILGKTYQYSDILPKPASQTMQTSTPSLDDLLKRRKQLQSQMVNYGSAKNDSTLSKLWKSLNKKETESAEYKQLENEYKLLQKQIDDFYVSQKQTTIDKVANTLIGNLVTAREGIKSSLGKAFTGNEMLKVNKEPLVEERLAQEALNQTNSKIGKTALQILGSTARMAPQAIMPGQAAATVVGFANYGGGAYRQALQEGKTEQQALAYGIANGTLEMGLQKVLGGLSSVYGKSALSKVTDKVMKNVVKNPQIREYLANIGSEFTEEYLQEILDPVVRNITMGENNKFKPFAEEALYSGIMGGLTAGLLESPNLIIKRGVNQTQINVPQQTKIQDNINTQPIVQTPQNHPVMQPQNNINNNSNNSIDRVLYHQTKANSLEEMNISLRGAGNTDTSTPSGIFLKETNEDIELEGKNQLELRTKINNPLIVENRAALNRITAESEEIYKLQQESRKFDEETYNIVESMPQNTIEEIEKAEAYYNERRKKAIEKAHVIQEKIKEFLKSKGYDGVIIENDRGSFGRNVKSYIVFDKSQLSTNKETNVPIKQETAKDTTNIPTQQEQGLNATKNEPDSTTNQNLSTEEKLRLKKEQKITKQYNNKIKDDIKEAAKVAGKILYFDDVKQKNKFKEILQKYVNSKNIDENQLREDIKNNFGEKILKSVDEDTINQATKYVKNFLDSEENLDTLIENIKISSKEIRKAKIEEYRELAKERIANIQNWKDKPRGLNYKLNIMKRNFFDIMPKQDAQIMYETYIAPITENNAKIEREITSYNKRIEELKLNNKESTAVQMLGELKYNPETELLSENVYKYIEENKLDKKKIENAIEVFRNIYDELIVRINTVLKEQGYEEIPYRKGYFPHFIEDKPTSILGKMAEKLGWKVNNKPLPTDIAGITDQFKPGKTWFSSALRREGKATDYNALKGFDNYIRGAMDIIYHTEDIQKLRALENEIRYQYSDKGVQDRIDEINNNEDLSLEEKQTLIDDVFAKIDNPFGNFVTELRSYTDNLANKKSELDRRMEATFGRQIYSVMTNVQNRLSWNMVGLNVSSALTNFIPLTQAWSQVKTKNMLKAIQETVTTSITDDGFADKSTFLTNRVKQADKLFKTGLDKVQDKAGILFEAIDQITSNIIVRGKYYDNIESGMTSEQALKNADEFAKDVMAGRDKGSMPTIFNSKNPFIKLLSAFQLEVNNQYGYMFKDMPRDLKDEGISKLIFAFIKMFLGAWLYNKVSENVTGRKSAFSPIDTISSIVQYATNKNLSAYEKVTKSAEDVIKELPFVGGILGGGRLPISSALPDIGTTVKSIFDLSDEDKKETAIKNLKNELLKPIFYIVPPFGGGQVKKTIEGLSMYKEDLPVPGSYTSSGQLRFPVKDDALSKIQAGIFGQYASEEAREYFDNNYKPLTKKQIQEFKDLNIPVKEYREYASGLSKLQTADEKRKYLIEKLPIRSKYYMEVDNEKYYLESTGEWQKVDIKLSNELKELKIKENDYFKLKYKLSLIKNDNTFSNDGKKKKIIDTIVNSNFNGKQKLYIYNKYYSSDEKIEALEKAGIKADIFLQLERNIVGIKSIDDPKSDVAGKVISGSKKEQVLRQIQNLPTTRINKLMLYAMQGYSLTANEKTEIYNYVNNLKLTAKEKKNIFEQMSSFQFLENGQLKRWW